MVVWRHYTEVLVRTPKVIVYMLDIVFTRWNIENNFVESLSNIIKNRHEGAELDSIKQNICF